MKNIITTAIALLALATVGLNAQTSTVTVTNYVTITNTITAPALTLGDSGHMPMDEAKAKGMPMELTLGGAGITIPHTGETSFGVDVGFSIQPLKYPIWFNLSQSLAWEPSFAGSTDVGADWSWAIVTDKLYLNTGWSVGAVYDTSTLGWRSGPEISLEYYTSGNVFLYVGANYDLINKESGGGWIVGDNNSPFRYSFGIGWAF